MSYNFCQSTSPRRVAILLLGGNKVGDNRWYAESILKADKLDDDHLQELDKDSSR